MTQAGPAIPVVASNQPPSGEAALRVAVVSDGRPIEAGPMRPIVEVFDNRPTQANEPLPIVVNRGNGFILAGPPMPVRVTSGYLGSAYGAKIAALGPIAFWPMDETSGTVAVDRSGNNRNGAYTGVTLGQTGPDGRPAAGFDGATSYTNVFSASFQAAFNGAEGSISIWARVANVGVWSDGVVRRFITLQVDANNRVYIEKVAGANTFGYNYVAGGVAKTRNRTTSTIAWFNAILTWSKSADQVIAYFNGVQEGATLNALGVWVGSIVSTNSNIGANATTPTSVWSGLEAYGAVFNRALSAAEVLSAASL